MAFLSALWNRATAYITGGSITAIVAIYVAFGGKTPEWVVWTFILLALIVAAFVAWREQFHKVCAKYQHDKLTEIIDLIRSETDFEKRYDSIGALIKHANDLNTEDEVKWYCEQLVKHGYKHPFEWLEAQAGDAFNGKWLLFLREARLNPIPIRLEIVAWGFATKEYSRFFERGGVTQYSR